MSVTALGQNQANTSDAKAQLPSDIEALSLVAPLAQLGYEQGEALPLIQAAQILVNFPSVETKRDKTTETAGGASDDKSQKPIVTIEQLLADAAELAEGNAALTTLISDVEAASNAPTRGAVGGPKYSRDRVNAGDTDIYNVRFKGNEVAYVYVSGDGDTDLDLYVYDENGNLIDSDTDRTDECIVYFTPRWTGNFKIKIKNLGRVYNRYTLRTN